jgi:hypothetical protein
VTAEIPQTETQFTVIVRGTNQPLTAGKPFTDPDPLKALQDALAWTRCEEDGPVIEWDGCDQLCCLDVDFHGKEHPEFWLVYRVISAVRPEPALYWTSHGGGLKLIFTAAGFLTAEDHAAIARMVLRLQYLNTSGIELKRQTQHPAYKRGGQSCGKVQQGYCGGLAEARRKLLSNVDTGASADLDKVDEYLTENGFTRGGRYPHTLCPIQPNDTCLSNPVIVGDYGIFCYRCKGKEVCYPGVSKPGFAPYSFLVDGTPARIVNHLRNAVRGMTHWEHARHFIADEEGYRALLKLWHLTDDNPYLATTARLIGRVFWPKVPLVWTPAGWMRSDVFAPAGKDGRDLLLKSLPAVCYPAEKDKIKVDPVRLGVFSGDYDKTEYGYPPIIPLRGADLAEYVRPMEDERVYAKVPAKPPFKYRASRDIEAARRIVEECYPGINIKLVYLLIACKGLVQRGELIDVPQVFITGQSGGGKSMTARLAAQIACDSADEMRFDPQRLLQAYADTSNQCSYALYNEASKNNVTGNQLRDFCLSFAKGVKYHQLYIGQRRIEAPAVVVLTDTYVFPELLASEQTARRIALVDLGPGVNAKGVNWLQTCGTGTVENWRAGGHADTADAILSDVMDKYFRDPSWTFRDIVHDCGFQMMDEVDDGTKAVKRRLYELVTALPEHDGSGYWTGPGWRVIHLQQDRNPAADLLREVTDDGKRLDAITETKWGVIVKVPEMECTVRRHGLRIGLRFRVRPQAAA